MHALIVGTSSRQVEAAEANMQNHYGKGIKGNDMSYMKTKLVDRVVAHNVSSSSETSAKGDHPERHKCTSIPKQ